MLGSGIGGPPCPESHKGHCFPRVTPGPLNPRSGRALRGQPRGHLGDGRCHAASPSSHEHIISQAYHTTSTPSHEHAIHTMSTPKDHQSALCVWPRRFTTSGAMYSMVPQNE